MKIKRVELTKFKRFTHLIIEDIPETARLVIMAGPNGSEKSSFLRGYISGTGWHGANSVTIGTMRIM
jgi:chromosome segregation ATPase